MEVKTTLSKVGHGSAVFTGTELELALKQRDHYQLIRVRTEERDSVDEIWGLLTRKKTFARPKHIALNHYKREALFRLIRATGVDYALVYPMAPRLFQLLDAIERGETWVADPVTDPFHWISSTTARKLNDPFTPTQLGLKFDAWSKVPE